LAGASSAGLDKQIESASRESVFWPAIEPLMALRGVNLLTATTVVAVSWAIGQVLPQPAAQR
jgi:hypothetical protein